MCKSDSVTSENIIEQINDVPVLKMTKQGLNLTDGKLSLRGDFEKMLPRIKQSNLEREILVKAVKIKGKKELFIIDATAGLGEDSFLLAAAGHRVRMYESDHTIASLLFDAMERAKKTDNLSPVMDRLELIEGDSIEAMLLMEKEGVEPDVILLDPMFPERTKSAKVKGKFQLLQQLECPCENEQQLFEAALVANPKKIVVKRPAKGALLAGKKPDYSIGGKAVRYDCYVLH